MMDPFRFLRPDRWREYRALQQQGEATIETADSSRTSSSDTYDSQRASVEEKRPLGEGLGNELHDGETEEEPHGHRASFATRRRRRVKRVVLLVLVMAMGLSALVLAAVWWIKIREQLSPPSTPSAEFPSPSEAEVDNNATPYSTRFGLVRKPVPLRIHAPLLTNQGEPLDAWLSYGSIPARMNVDTSASAAFDTLTFWVNGSDPRHFLARAHLSRDPKQRLTIPGFASPSDVLEETGTISRRDLLQNDPNRFRDNGELLYHLRSTRHFIMGLRTQHLVATDFGPQQSRVGDAANGLRSDWFEIEDGQGFRQGQVPSWMDLNSDVVSHGDHAKSSGGRAGGKPPMLKLHHDWNVAVPVGSKHAANSAELASWKSSRLPSFNSMALEAMLGLHVPGLSEAFVYNNDDMFHSRLLSAGDFFSPLYGPLIHVNVDYLVPPNPSPFPGIEASGLERSAWMLGRRFGMRRGYPYTIHISKPFYGPIVHEARLMWPEAFERATSERFRGSGIQAQNHMLVFGMLMERHREALLWSFLVAKLDVDGNGRIEGDELLHAFKELGDPKGEGGATIEVIPAQRDSAKGSHFHEQTRRVRFPEPMASSLVFTSMDGYHGNKPNLYYLRPNRPPPKQRVVKSSRGKQPYCTIDLTTCWPWKGAIESETVFKQFAFENPQCGDCTILHLINRSGKLGMSAFFPPSSSMMPGASSPASSSPLPPHLPLVEDWHAGNFSLSAVASASRAGGISRRFFTQQLVHRYTHSIASAPAKFAMLTTPAAASTTFDSIADVREGLAFLCINDDMNEGTYKDVQRLLRKFFERTWPSSTMRLPFELGADKAGKSAAEPKAPPKAE